jgi:hypothetical protein
VSGAPETHEKLRPPSNQRTADFKRRIRELSLSNSTGTFPCPTRVVY